MMKIPAVFLFLLILFTGPGLAQPVRHVLLIGIDGVSAEGFQYSRTPVMDKLIRSGCISLKTRAVMPTVSAPNWASILSGAGPEQHGVTSNSWSLANQPFEPTVKDPDGYFTSLFTLIRRQKPETITGMFYDWDWLGTFVNQKMVSGAKLVSGYRNVTPPAVDFIKAKKPLFTFVYYGHPDEVMHEIGHGTPAYFQAITDIDTEIGKLVDALKEAGIFSSTCILVVSDHGGIGKGHGGESRVEIEVPWIISGPGIGKNRLLVGPNDQFNTAPTIAKLLALKMPQEWVGRPFQEAFFQPADAKKKFPVYVPKPYCSLREGVYATAQQFELTNTDPEVITHYTLDGILPDEKSLKYTGPVTVSSTCILNAIALKANQKSDVITARFSFAQGIREVILTTPPNPKYPGSGANSLFDGLIGSSNYKGRQWMGWEEEDFEATIDFGERRTLSSVGLDVLQLPEAWIFLPALIEYSVSDDGKSFSRIATYNPADVDDIRKDGPVLLTRMFDPLSTRFLRVKARNIGTCPAGHKGEGGKAWLFVSEIEVE